MNHYKTSAELKNLAKDKLDGRYGMAVLTVFISELIAYTASFFVALFIPTGSVGVYILSQLISLLVSAIAGILNAGICYFFLNMACGQSFDLKNLFYGFQQQTNKCLALSLFFTILQSICMTPYQIYSFCYLTRPNFSNMLIMLGCMTGGLLLYMPLSLAISQSFYLILDFPELSTRETLQKSIQIMKGHKGRLFYIEMSFLPLMFLCLLTCGIGFLWLMPYMYMTQTLFFLDIMNPARTE